MKDNGRDDNHHDHHVIIDHSVALANMKCHEKVDFYLHRPVVEYAIIFFIIIDALLVTASLLIEINIIEIEPKVESHDGVTDPDLHETVVKLEHAAEALHITSLVILTLFMIEVLLKLFGQREKFFKRKVQVIDSFVVAISFALDIAVILIADVNSAVLQGLNLLILLRLWRLVRIVNGAVVATKERLTETVHHAKREAADAKEAVNQLEMQLDDKDREIEFLKGRLCKYEPIEMLPTGSTRLPAYLPETREFPKQVLGDVTDDEEYRLGFSDLNTGPRPKPRPALNYTGTAFQTYQPGSTYQVTSQYPESSNKPPAAAPRQGPVIGRAAANGRAAQDYHNDVVDTADESDVASIKPSKARSGNTFTVKKDGVPMTSL